MLQFAVQLSMQHAFCLLLIGGVVQKLAQIIVFGCSNQAKFRLSIALFPGEVIGSENNIWFFPNQKIFA